MGWTPLFLKMDQKKVLIIGAGEVGERRALTFLGAGADVIITGGTVPQELINLGAKTKPVAEIEKWVEWSDLVVIASGDPELNEKVAFLAKNNSKFSKKLLNRADHPFEGDVIVPTSFFIGDIQISIFTGGKSPLMARSLRKKIQSIIDEKDVLHIELQDYTRYLLKELSSDQKQRKDYLYKIFNDPQIDKFLENGDLDSAKEYIKSYLKDIGS